MAKKSAELTLVIKQLGGEILDRLVITVDDVVSAVMQIPKFVGAAITAYREQEQAVNELNRSMINQGIYSADLQNKYLELADALSKVTLYTDDQINQAQATLQAMIGNKEVTEDLLKATMDLATAKKMDLSSAAELVGKAFANENDILKRQGIQLDETAAKTDKLGAIIDAVENKFSGYAQEAANSTGATLNVGKAFGELTEAIGSRLAPATSSYSVLLAKLLNTMASWVGTNDLMKQSAEQLGQKATELEIKIVSLTQKWEALNKQGQANPGDKSIIDMYQAQLDQIRAIQEKAKSDEITSEENKAQILSDKKQTAWENQQIKDAENKAKAFELAAKLEDDNQAAMFAAQAEFEMRKAESATTFETKLQAIKNAGQLRQLQSEAAHRAKTLEINKKADEETAKNRESTLNKIATLQTSSNSTLAAAGKAAAITQIAIETPVAITRALAAFPPPFNFAAAALVGAAAAQQAAAVAGIPLAEGGIVRARPGGVQATIGEGGQDEAVIPLDRAGEFGFGGGGGGTTIIVYGGLLGDERTAQEFAVAVDRELFKLRRDNQSLAFDDRAS